MNGSLHQASFRTITLNRYRHQHFGGGQQANIFTSRKLKLAGCFAAQAEPEKPLVPNESNRADDAMRAISLGVCIVQFDQIIVAILHRTSKNGFHWGGSRIEVLVCPLQLLADDVTRAVTSTRSATEEAADYARQAESLDAMVEAVQDVDPISESTTIPHG